MVKLILVPVFDNGHLKENPVAAQKVIDVLLSDMGIHPENDICERDRLPARERALVDVHRTVWSRIAHSSPKGTHSISWFLWPALGTNNWHTEVQQRFVRRMHDYCKGSMEQVKWRSQGRFPSIEDTHSTRRKSAGVAPLYALAEYALKLDLPNAVFENESIQEIERIGVDFVVM
jgi:hypothetical protein